MKVQDIMTREVKRCGPDINLAAAVELMWDNDCGVLPVVDTDQKVIGMITDRDICIALGTRNLRASNITVGEIISGEVYACSPQEDIHEALSAIRQQKVRRLPVIDSDGVLQGILCFNDIVLHADKSDAKKGISYEEVVSTLKAICDHGALATTVHTARV
jgi:CBS domain-containing protein